ncbi:GAF and ANTAR domain-containing protein [Williamsia muralis]|uniref:GAF and ANTAR domain-containing protein n=1 Tax=Williamsia marianensis TaxID=85044 RepID=UPI000DE5D411|nr:GAF and ANTAR domain-containing protein [Williamsia marianensis]PVY29549.1 response regulator receiver and ANTAR domain protein [Williamsia marianensis]
MSTENNDAYKRIAELARDMSEHLPNDSATALGELIHNAVDHIPGASYAGITVVSRQNRDVATPAATHEVPRTLDALQQKHREGPCFDAAVEHDSYYISNLYGERRWPRFCADAIEQTPIQSIAAFQLFTTRDAVGALNLYSEIPGAFDQESRDLGYIFAAHAATVWGALQRGEQFRSALASRDTIGQAKGMIMERYSVNAIQAFDLLRKLSQESNIRLYDIARQLVENDHPSGAR